MANEVKTPIPARLYNVAVGGHVAGADDIIDDKTGMVVSELVGNKPATSEENPFNGMGVVILPMNIQEVEEDDTTVQKNILTQGMMSAQNTKYVIKYDYVLGEDITVPEGCVLEFDGGSIATGVYNINGNIVNDIIKLSWFKQSNKDGELLNWLCSKVHKVDIDRDVVLESLVNCGDNNVEIFSSNNSTIRVNCNPSYVNNNTWFAWIYSINSPSITIHNINIDFEGKQYPMPKGEDNVYVGCGILIYCPRFCHLYEIEVKNYGKTEGVLEYDAFSAINVKPGIGSSVNIHNMIFRNIHVVSDNYQTVTQIGMGECIQVYYLNSDETASPCTITNISCYDCYSVAKSSGISEADDFDCIHIDSIDENKRLTSCVISNCYFENINKRGIKAQATNISITDIIYRNPGNIQGLSTLIQPFGENCHVARVDATLTTDGNIITGGHVSKIHITDCIFRAESNNLNVQAVQDVMRVDNCVFINIKYAIQILDRIEEEKYYGVVLPNIIDTYFSAENCYFYDCYLVFSKRISNFTGAFKFINCTIYNCGYISITKTELHHCKITKVYDSMTESVKIMPVFQGQLQQNVDDYGYLLLNDCEIKCTGTNSHFISTHFFRKDSDSIDIEIIIRNCRINNNGNRLIARNEGGLKGTVNFNKFIIEGTETDAPLQIQSDWTGKICIINSLIPIYNTNITLNRDLRLIDATFSSGKINIDGCNIGTTYNNIAGIDLIIGMPVTGTLYWQNGKPTWSDGTAWVDATGTPV